MLSRRFVLLDTASSKEHLLDAHRSLTSKKDYTMNKKPVVPATETEKDTLIFGVKIVVVVGLVFLVSLLVFSQLYPLPSYEEAVQELTTMFPDECVEEADFKLSTRQSTVVTGLFGSGAPSASTVTHYFVICTPVDEAVRIQPVQSHK